MELSKFGRCSLKNSFRPATFLSLIQEKSLGRFLLTLKWLNGTVKTVLTIFSKILNTKLQTLQLCKVSQICQEFQTVLNMSRSPTPWQVESISVVKNEKGKYFNLTSDFKAHLQPLNYSEDKLFSSKNNLLALNTFSYH